MDNEEPIRLPPYAHIPGVNARHDHEQFESICQSVEGVALAELPATSAWKHGLAYMEREYFWEAHEVLEPVWMACPPNSAEKLFVQSLIQQANAGLKRKMGREQAAERLDAEAQRLRAEAESRMPEGMFKH